MARKALVLVALFAVTAMSGCISSESSYDGGSDCWMFCGDGDYSYDYGAFFWFPMMFVMILVVVVIVAVISANNNSNQTVIVREKKEEK